MPFAVETPLSIHRWPMGAAEKPECLKVCRHLGLKDAVEFRKEGGVSCLVFV